MREALLAHTCTRETQLTRVSADVLASGLREQFESGDPILLDVALKAEGAGDEVPRFHSVMCESTSTAPLMMSFWLPGTDRPDCPCPRSCHGRARLVLACSRRRADVQVSGNKARQTNISRASRSCVA